MTKALGSTVTQTRWTSLPQVQTSGGPTPLLRWNVWWRNKSRYCLSLPLTSCLSVLVPDAVIRWHRVTVTMWRRSSRQDTGKRCLRVRRGTFWPSAFWRVSREEVQGLKFYISLCVTWMWVSRISIIIPMLKGYWKNSDKEGRESINTRSVLM